MLKTTTSQRIEDVKGYIDNYSLAIASCDELLKALNDYQKNIINKTFFEKYFLIKGEYKNYTKYSLSAPQYNFQEGKRIYLGKDKEIIINSNKKLDIIAIIKEEREKFLAWQAQSEQELSGYQEFDEQAFYTDLKKLYTKYNSPKNWRDLMENSFYKFN